MSTAFVSQLLEVVEAGRLSPGHFASIERKLAPRVIAATEKSAVRDLGYVFGGETTALDRAGPIHFGIK